MAEYKWSNTSEYGDSSLKSISYVSRSITIIHNDVLANIPRYSNISKVVIGVDAYQTIALGSTKADMQIFFSDSWSYAEYYVVDGDGNVPKNSYTHIYGDATKYFTTSGVDAGKVNSTILNNCANLYWYIHASVVRTLKFKNRYITWTYTPPTYTISVSSNNTNYGTVSGGGTWNVTTSDFTKTITATPKTGYKFVNWSDGNTNASRNITISQNSISSQSTKLSLTATFEPISYTLTVTASTGGTVSGGGTYNYGSTPTIKATPSTGYKFVKWSDGNTSATRTVTVTANATYTAIFELDKINKIYVGTAQPSKIYVGTQEVKEVYVGTTKVYG